VFGFAKQTGGGVRIITAIGEGTTVEVYLPRAARAVIEPDLPKIGFTARPQSAVILVVDDDSTVREVTAAMLEDLGYSVVEAGSGGAAVDLVANEPAVDLVVLDYAMPGLNGVEAAKQIVQKRPGLPIIFVTGYADATAFDSVPETDIVSNHFGRRNWAGGLARRSRQRALVPTRSCRFGRTTPSHTARPEGTGRVAPDVVRS
jgi:CheY-like chemotaxis protein